MVDDFEERVDTLMCRLAGEARCWKDNYGAAYSTRVRVAIDMIDDLSAEIEALLVEDEHGS